MVTLSKPIPARDRLGRITREFANARKGGYCTEGERVLGVAGPACASFRLTSEVRRTLPRLSEASIR